MNRNSYQSSKIYKLSQTAWRNIMKKPKIAVIGAGIAGITSAYWLSRSGFDVVIFEANSNAAMGTSRANGSQLSACNAEVWTQWHLIGKAISWLGNPAAPLKIGLWPEPKKISWLIQFLYHTCRGDHENRTAESIQLIIESHQALDQVIKTTGVRFDHEKRGIAHVYSDPKSLEKAQSLAQLFESNGCEWKSLDRDQLLALEPGLAHSSYVGGIFSGQDSSGDMFKFCNGVERWMTKRGLAQFVYNTSVQKLRAKSNVITVDNSEFDGVVLATGSLIDQWAPQFGNTWSVYPVKGYSITVPVPGYLRNQITWVSLLDNDAKIVASRLGPKTLRVAGTAELNGHNLDITKSRIDPLIQWTKNLWPELSLVDAVPWAGLRPMTPNMMPVYRASKNSDRVWYHGCHGHLGWSMSNATARRLSMMMAESFGIG
jgi:D-amino-acid dehydrogenase